MSETNNYYEPARAARSAKAMALGGELFIIMSTLIVLFLGWQLFYTDIQAARTLGATMDEIGWIDDSTSRQNDDVDGTGAIPEDMMFTDDPPVMGDPGHAETFAVMYVPRWGSDYEVPVSQGVTRKDVLDVKGVGHYPDTAMPGEWGNFALAAHRTSYGKPFSEIETLEEGDAVIVRTEDAWYVYEVFDWEIVQPDEVRAIAPIPGESGSEPDGRYITLTTCHPKFSAAQRWVTYGELLYWAPTGHGVPSEMMDR